MSTADTQDSARGDPAPLSSKATQQRSNEARRRVLTHDEVVTIRTLRAHGQRMDDIAKLLRIGGKPLRLGCRANGIPTLDIEARARQAATAFRKYNHSKRLTLFDNEVEIILRHRARGRAWHYIAEEIGVHRDIITRELRALGISTPRLKPRPTVKERGKWRSFEPTNIATLP